MIELNKDFDNTNVNVRAFICYTDKEGAERFLGIVETELLESMVSRLDEARSWIVAEIEKRSNSRERRAARRRG